MLRITKISVEHVRIRMAYGADEYIRHDRSDRVKGGSRERSNDGGLMNQQLPLMCSVSLALAIRWIN